MSDALGNVVVDARIVYSHLQKVDRFGKYTCVLILDKKDPIVKKIGTELKALAKATFAGKKLQPNRNPVRPAADDFGEEFEDCVQIRCQSPDPVRLLNPDKTPITSDKVMRNGSNVKALVAFSAYVSPEWGPGITCFVNAVQFVSKGDPIGRVAPNADEFLGVLEGVENPEQEAAAAAETPGDDPESFFTS